MNSLRKATITIAFGFLLLILGSCGGSSAQYCIPNFSQGNFGAKVTYLLGSLNTYEFQVCYNDSFAGSQISVYGVETENNISTISPSTDVRLGHMTDGLRPGDTFSVTFSNDDVWFAIFKDDSLGNLDTTTEILRGQFR